MKSNLELQRDVQNSIEWEPMMYSENIKVNANNGTVSLTGMVDNYSKKVNAERIAKNVIGVRAIIDDIKIDYNCVLNKPDAEITQDVLSVWKQLKDVPEDRMIVKVKDGWLQMEGDVSWKYQEEAAEKAVTNLEGIKGVTNLVEIKSESKDSIEKNDLKGALKRNWAIHSMDVKVEVENNNVKLTGIVNSIFQKEEASRLAWNTPGVWTVDNELAVIN